MFNKACVFHNREQSQKRSQIQIPYFTRHTYPTKCSSLSFSGYETTEVDSAKGVVLFALEWRKDKKPNTGNILGEVFFQFLVCRKYICYIYTCINIYVCIPVREVSRIDRRKIRVNPPLCGFVELTT